MHALVGERVDNARNALFNRKLMEGPEECDPPPRFESLGTNQLCLVIGVTRRNFHFLSCGVCFNKIGEFITKLWLVTQHYPEVTRRKKTACKVWIIMTLL